MNENLPIVYISALLAILIFAAIYILREVIKTRKQETTFSRLQKKLKKEKGTAEEYYQLGSLYLDKKLFVALKLYPEYVVAFNNLGNVYEKKQMIMKAVSTYKEALQYDPENKTAKQRITSLEKRLVSSKSK